VLRSFAAHPTRDIVTVMKGPLARGKTVEPCGPWLPFRERDQVREGRVVLGAGSGQPELSLRVVEMTRPDSRNVKTIGFVTTAPPETLATQLVPAIYLARWPFQEDLHRRGRNGAGLERSGGYGVDAVTHLAVVEPREKAARRLAQAATEMAAASDGEARAVLQLAVAEDRLAQRRTDDETPLDGRHALGVRQARQRLTERQAKQKLARRKQEQAHAEYQTGTPAR